MQWLRLYTEVLDDPKVQRLPDHLFKTWVNLLCLARKNEGQLPVDIQDMAFALRLSADEMQERFEALKAAGLFDGAKPHNWSGRQFKSDHDGNERVRRYRSKQRNVTRNVTCNDDETPPDSETEQIQNRTEKRARAKPPDKSTDPPPERLAFDAWNELAAECGLPHADVFDADRAGKIRARLKECGGLDGWKHALNRIRGSPFLLGQVDGKDFRAHLDFVLQKRSFRKLMEGTYDGNHTASKPEKSAARAASDAAMARVFGGCEPGDNGTEPAAAGCAGNGRGPHWGTGNVVGPGTAEGNGGIAKTAVKPLPHAAHDRGGT